MVAQTFTSKIDTWLLLVMLGTPVVVLVGVMPSVRSGALPAAALVALSLPTVVLPIWLLAGTRYVVDEAALHIRCGPFRWSVPVAEITSITPTNSALSSPALSLDRLEIRYGSGRSVLVSPADRDGFLAAIGRRRQPSV